MKHKPAKSTAELRRTVERQERLLDNLSADLQRALDCQEELQASLDDVRDVVASRGPMEIERSPYQQLVRRLRELVRRHVPRDVTVLIASKGDPELLKLFRRTGWHFPRATGGGYPGFHPACSLAAIAQLEALRANGAQYLLFPDFAFWWFDHYAEFRQHLEERYRLITKDDAGLIYSLEDSPDPAPADLGRQLARVASEFEGRYEREPAFFDLCNGKAVAAMPRHYAVFQPPGGNGSLPYIPGSVDIVVTGGTDPLAAREAERIARSAVVTVHSSGNGKRPAVDVRWLEERSSAQWPTVSIIVPCFNGSTLVDGCLRPLKETLPDWFQGEVIVVDDALEPGERIALVEGGAAAQVKIIRNRRKLGLAESCNRAARQAAGEILVFLSPEIALLPGWLRPLLRVFRHCSRPGVAGGKLLSPDGALAEAGGVVFNDGSTMRFGEGDVEIEAPLYNFVRSVDYCSESLLATPRALWKELGGFGAGRHSGWSEGVDYCFRARENGLRVYFQPEAVAVYRKAMPPADVESSNGNRASSFAKRRWLEKLKHQPERPGSSDKHALQALAFRGVARREMAVE